MRFIWLVLFTFSGSLAQADELFYTTQSFCWPASGHFEIAPRYRYNLRPAGNAGIDTKTLKGSYGIQVGNGEKGTMAEICTLKPSVFRAEIAYATIPRRYLSSDCLADTQATLVLWHNSQTVVAIPFGHGCLNTPDTQSLAVDTYGSTTGFTVTVCMKNEKFSPAEITTTQSECKTYNSTNLLRTPLTAEQLRKDISFSSAPH